MFFQSAAKSQPFVRLRAREAALRFKRPSSPGSRRQYRSGQQMISLLKQTCGHSSRRAPSLSVFDLAGTRLHSGQSVSVLASEEVTALVLAQSQIAHISLHKFHVLERSRGTRAAPAAADTNCSFVCDLILPENYSSLLRNTGNCFSFLPTDSFFLFKTED